MNNFGTILGRDSATNPLEESPLYTRTLQGTQLNKAAINLDITHGQVQKLYEYDLEIIIRVILIVYTVTHTGMDLVLLDHLKLQ